MHDTDSGLLIIDVDNTIYDWIGIWARAFDAMTRLLAEETGRDVFFWRATLRDVHIRRRTLECPGALEDLAAVSKWAPFAGREHVLTRAAGVYRRTWDTQLAPYDGIRDALVRLTGQGWRVVAYTESDAAVAATRLSRMGLAGLIPRVFGRARFSAPAHRDRSLVEIPARLPLAIDQVPRLDMKPNPAGLRDIVARCGNAPWRTVYVGDDLWTDVVMAHQAGVRALWAKYGAAHRTEHVELLESVTHWSPADLAAARAASAIDVTPEATLHDATELADAVIAMPAAIG